MSRFILSLTVVAGLMVSGVATVEAKGSGGHGSGSGSHAIHSSSGGHLNGMSGSHMSGSHMNGNHGSFFHSRQSNWGSRSWNSAYGCYCYYNPTSSCYYYWCSPYQCYYPVSYCPTGNYNYNEPGY